MKNSVLFLLLIVSIILSCNRKDDYFERRPLVILSVNNNSVNSWLKSIDTNLTVIAAYSYSWDTLLEILQFSDGIIITGGEDINPALYGKKNELQKCGKINKQRDTLEIRLINYAIANNIPLLGICRGLQMINVAMGGTLYTDLPTDIGSDTLHRNNGKTFHIVYIAKNTLLYNIVKTDTGTVYSNHHQGIETLGRHLKPAAYAPDSLIEAVEFYDTIIHPCVLAVQWHPEAMKRDNPLNFGIAKYFLRKIFQHFSNRTDKY